MRKWRHALGLILIGLIVVAAGPLSRRLRAVDLLQRLSGEPASTAPLVERDLTIAGRTGPIRARLYYSAQGGKKPGLVVAHGVHYQGIDERRLVPFARELARAGRVVLTPELRELADYRITRHGVDVISDSVRWLASERELVSSERVGVLGFSFAGGLGLVAAEQPELDGKLEFVTSVGGHHDLGRVLGFFLSDRVPTPHGLEQRKAHEYGLVVLLYGELDHFVEEPDRETLRDALRAWLHEDRAGAIARASQRTTLSGERLFVLLQQGRLLELAPELERLLQQRQAELAALSPRGRLRDVGVPVYLLHGSGDSVIPPSETEWAGLELAGAPHRALVSPLLEHVSVSGTAGLVEKLELVDFMSRLL
ncbi:MAG TPA: dienelactone hydrolase family protein [Polyangiaceae bacterium]|nr:dienelactone hydrolase family protein [Polyangiaceae bacterium]